MALKLPFQNKKIKIPIINRKFSALVVVLAVLIAGGVWYFKFRDTKTGVTTGIKKVSMADIVQAQVAPQLVKPSTSIKIAGTFTDAANQPVETANAKYYVFQEDVNEGRKLVGSGLLGNGVSSFQRVIPLSGLTVGRYSILITDENINLADYGLLNIGPGPYGTGQGVGYPSDAVPPLGGVLQPTLGYGSGR
jgi:hypothetical protein